MYSGVPKAGAPVRMSTFEVNDPMAHGTPGFTHWSSTMADSPSATNWVTAPAMVTGAIAPASVNGVTMVGCPRRASRIAPSSIGQSCLSGEEELMLVYMRGRASNSSWVSPPAMRTISITSSTRAVPSAYAWAALSVRVSLSWRQSRWRIEGCRSTGSTGYPPAMWMQLKYWVSLRKSR